MEPAPIWTDLKTFPWSSFRDRVDILTGGYPCQPFSSAGKRAGKEDPRHLWPWIADGIRILRPRVCFFENVEGHISLGLSSVISDLEELGYKVSWGIFSASEVGAPHQRKRVFILAHSADQRPEWSSILGSPSASEAVERCGAWNGESCESELANTENQHGRHTIGSEKKNTELALRGQHLWPSRPGEPQHGWEPPRVVGNTKHDGLPTEPLVRGDEEASDKWWQEEQTETRKLARASRPIDVSSLQGGTSGGEWMGNSKVVGNAEVLQCDGGDYHSRDCQRSEEVSQSRDSSWEATGVYRQAQPSLGGDSNGPSDWMDYAELYTTCDNRTDELRLLGNGVVPATAERAFRVLMNELMNI